MGIWTESHLCSYAASSGMIRGLETAGDGIPVIAWGKWHLAGGGHDDVAHNVQCMFPAPWWSHHVNGMLLTVEVICSRHDH